MLVTFLPRFAVHQIVSLGQNSTCSKIKWTSFECSIHADHNATNPSFLAQDTSGHPPQQWQCAVMVCC